MFLRRLRKAAVVAAGLLMATKAIADNTIASVSMKSWRGGTTIAVQAVVVGDNDTNAVVRIFQRKWAASNPPAYDTGMVMPRRPGTHVYNGRILWLPIGQTADFFVKADDGGTPQQSAADTASPSRYKLPIVSGTQYYVNQATGNNTWDGSSPTFVSGTIGPKLTITSAVAKLNTDNAPTGSVINVAIGEYHERVVLTSTTNGRFYSIIGASRDSTIICGANENVEQGRRDASNAIAWTHLVTNADAVAQTELATDSVYICTFPSQNGPADSTQLIVLGFGEYIHRKQSLWGVMRDSTKVPVNCFASGNNDGELSGWYWSGDTLYVKRRNGQAPSVSGNHFGYRDDLIQINNRNWNIRNLTVRFAGGVRNDNLNTEAAYKTTNALVAGLPNPINGVNGHGITFGGSGINSSGATIINVTVYGCNAVCIYAPIFSANGRADSVTVAGCILDGRGVGAMAYTAQKCRVEEGMDGTDIRGAMENVIDNTFTALAKGCVSGTNIAVETDSTNGSRCEYSGNLLRLTADDGIEVDGSPDINNLVLSNRVFGSVSGFSAIGGRQGPVFVFYNQLYARTNGVKMASGNTGTYLIYHNTIMNGVNSVGGFAQHYYLRNNIIVKDSSTALAVTGPDAGADSARIRTNEWNYNGYNVAASGNNIAKWASTNRTLATFRSVFNQEQNGKELVGSAQGGLGFFSAPAYKVNLVGSSGAIDAGARISGVNTAWGAARYVNKPDLGAIEYTFSSHQWFHKILSGHFN